MVRGADARRLTAATLETVQRPAETPKKSIAQDNRAHNRRVVLGLLHREGALSRPQLVRRTGLSAPSVAAVVTDLLAAGIVRDIGTSGVTRIGKPPALVEIASDDNAVLAVDLSPSGVFVGGVVDLAGQVIARRTVAADGLVGDAAVAAVETLLDELRAAAPGQVLGVGVATPGLVGGDGRIYLADRLAWRDLALGTRLRERTGLPTVVGNDVNLAALGVRGFRDASGRDLILVTIENGVGAALLISGAVVAGEKFAAGEIGHLTVEPGGDLCLCGRHGCLDPIASAVYLRRRLADAPDDVRERELVRAGTALAAALAPAVSLLNVNEVALAGPADLIDGPLLDQTRRELHERTQPATTAELVVSSYSDDPDLVLLGAAAAVMEAELFAR